MRLSSGAFTACRERNVDGRVDGRTCGSGLHHACAHLRAALVLVGSLSRLPMAQSSAPDDSICLMIESAARDHGLPVEFFARVIWQESRFRADAVGPVTRSGKRAQGMAQFMPGTAAERGLLDPFDPVQALPKSAEFLKELWGQFGNLGLAAAAYNAGPRRIREWLDGTGYMPGETRNYVSAITGLTVEDWAAERRKTPRGARKVRSPSRCVRPAAPR